MAIEIEIAGNLTRSEDSFRVPDIGIVLGKVVGFESGSPVVLFEHNDEHFCMVAIATLRQLCPETDQSTQVCIGFSDCDLHRPIVLGKLQGKPDHKGSGLTLNNDKEIVLRCGKASIQLKADGTVSIRGTNVASRAKHTNRIRGGNVQIN